MFRRTCVALVVAAAWLTSGASRATAQAVTLEAYNDLLARIKALEADKVATAGGVQVPQDAGQGIPAPAVGTFHGGGNSGCCAPPCYSPCRQPCWPTGSYVRYENVILKPHFSRDSAFFIDDPIGGDPVDFSEIPFNQSLEYSPRVEFGHVSECGIGWRVRTWSFNHTANRSWAAFDSINASFSGRDDRATIDIRRADSIQAEHKLKLDVVDLEASKLWRTILLSGGLRIARMDQVYQASAVNSREDDFIRGKHDFDGVGPTLAVDAYAPVGGGFSLFAKARTSLLFGESNFRAFSMQAGVFDGDVITRDNGQDLINVYEIQLGGQWMYGLQNGASFFVSAALEAQHWANAGTGLPGRHGNDDGNYIDSWVDGEAMGLFGFNIGIGVIY